MVLYFRHDLDQDHYGLEKLKKRVIEYLAVRKLKNSLKGEQYSYTLTVKRIHTMLSSQLLKMLSTTKVDKLNVQ